MGNYVSFKREFGLILVGAIIFTASFLWKDLLMDIENIIFPKQNDIVGRIMFTIIVTVGLVYLAVHMKNFLGLNQPADSPIRFDDDPIGDNDDAIDNDTGINFDILDISDLDSNGFN